MALFGIVVLLWHSIIALTVIFNFYTIQRTCKIGHSMKTNNGRIELEMAHETHSTIQLVVFKMLFFMSYLISPLMDDLFSLL